MTIVEELQAYLGTNYDQRAMVWNNEKMAAAIRGMGSFRAFLNDKVAVHLFSHVATSEWRLPHIQLVHEVVPSGASVLEYHARVGGFGLRLRPGYELAFADAKSKCTAFLKWRLKQRGLDAPVYDIDKDEIPVHDAVICFEALPYYEPDAQWGFVQLLATLGELVVMNIDKRNLEVEGFMYPVDWEGLINQIRTDYQMVVHKTVNVYVNLLAFRTGAQKSEREK